MAPIAATSLKAARTCLAIWKSPKLLPRGWQHRRISHMQHAKLGNEFMMDHTTLVIFLLPFFFKEKLKDTDNISLRKRGSPV